jgi:tRNA pseudouridine38-40 synthase
VALDAGLMARAASRVVGRHDFASLAGAGDGVPWSARRDQPRGTVRTVLACSVAEVPAWWAERGQAGGKLIELRIAADGFLPRMVRNLVGAVVDVGRQRRPVDWVDQLLTASDRRAAPAPLPPTVSPFGGWVRRPAGAGPKPTDRARRAGPGEHPPVAA